MGLLFWVIVLALLAGCGLVYLIAYSKDHTATIRAADSARSHYETALAQLRMHPASPEHKQHALELGQHYAKLTRNQKGVRVFDESDLADDINLATSMAAPHASEPSG